MNQPELSKVTGVKTTNMFYRVLSSSRRQPGQGHLSLRPRGSQSDSSTISSRV